MTADQPLFDADNALLVGRVLGAHGLRGEIKVQPLTDFPDRFEPGSELWLDREPVLVQASRQERRMAYLKLRGVATREQAAAMAGKELFAVGGTEKLEQGQFFRHDILGLSVRDRAGEVLGAVADILVTGANDVYVVRGERGELLLPALDDVVLQVDLERREMVVELMEGLEFTPPKSGRQQPRA